MLIQLPSTRLLKALPSQLPPCPGPPLTAYLNLSCRMFPSSKPVPSLPGLLPSCARSQFPLTSPSPTSDTIHPFPKLLLQPHCSAQISRTAPHLLTAPAPFHQHTVPSFLSSRLFSLMLSTEEADFNQPLQQITPASGLFQSFQSLFPFSCTRLTHS